MEKIDTGIPGLYELRPRVFKDERGWFKEALNLATLADLGIETPRFVQTNQSMTVAGTFRGLHFQAPPFAQAKYVRCIVGELCDIVVDIRQGSPTYGQRFEILLTAENHKVLYVPTGFAHGFHALTDCHLEYAIFGSSYRKDAEGGLRVERTAAMEMNARDASWPSFAEFVSPFVFEAVKELARP